MLFLQLTPIANAITLVELLVPINSHSIDGWVDREVGVTCSDPLRHESRRLTDLHQELCPSVNGTVHFSIRCLWTTWSKLLDSLAGAGAHYYSHAWFGVGTCGGGIARSAP